MYPYRADMTTRTPGPAFEPCIDGLLSIPQKNRQPLSVVSTCFFHVIFVEAVFQKSYVCKSRIGLNAQVLGVHHAAPLLPCSCAVSANLLYGFGHVNLQKSGHRLR